MTGNHGLACSVSDAGIFIHFIANDGSETHIDVLNVLDCSTAMTNKPLLQWCCERLDEVPENQIPEEARWELLTNLEDIASSQEAELEEAQNAGANVDYSESLENIGEWLHRAERATYASSVMLTREAFEALLALARKGSR
jgi:hypothetical protein